MKPLKNTYQAPELLARMLYTTPGEALAVNREGCFQERAVALLEKAVEPALEVAIPLYSADDDPLTTYK